ncbi:MAG: dihydrolipoyl dehydrogenase [Candidatus Nanohaloarchaea archaeon]
MEEFDVIVIGAGSGLDVASAYASRGQDVAVVEPGPLGGTCLNRGCIPSKMLIHRADIVETVEDADRFGIDAEVEDIEFEKIVEKVNETVAEDARSIKRGIRDSEHHTLFESEARFVDEKVVEVDTDSGDAVKITAETIMVAAGSRPMVPPVDGMEDVDYLTSREALELQELPEELVVVGGGYIAAELAHFFDRMGSDITIIEMGDTLIGNEDREIAEKFTGLAQDIWDVNLGLRASRVEETGGKIRVVAEDEDGNSHSFAGDELLVAAGRVPNSDRLDVEEAGIETDDRGFIETDEYLETSVEGVYALGDIAGNWMFKHSAKLEAEYAFRNSLSGNEKPLENEAMPHAIFSSPQVAGVGSTEQELEESGQDYVKATYDYSDTGMGLALKEEDGFVKVLASEDGEILGCHIIGPQASSIIHEVLVAMNAGTGHVEDIQDTVHIHPALNEVVQRAFKRL